MHSKIFDRCSIILKFAIQKTLLLLIMIYQIFISPLLGRNCRFEPTCSQYAKEAIIKKGALKGIYLIVKRLSRCHPWHKGGYDPLP